MKVSNCGPTIHVFRPKHACYSESIAEISNQRPRMQSEHASHAPVYNPMALVHILYYFCSVVS